MDVLPPPTSSLLSIAPKRGLLAAGGPTSVVIATTEAAREAFMATGNNDIKPFTPQLTLDIGIRVLQVAFSSDESSLVISAEREGGLSVYAVESLLQGNTQSAFALATAQQSIRALVPNPAVETAELFALVTENGHLLMANMRTRQLSNTLRDNVSCIAWSAKGKQVVAGLSDGSAAQMTPEGEVKQYLPRPPGLAGDQHGKLNFFTLIQTNYPQYQLYLGLTILRFCWSILHQNNKNPDLLITY